MAVGAVQVQLRVGAPDAVAGQAYLNWQSWMPQGVGGGERLGPHRLGNLWMRCCGQRSPETWSFWLSIPAKGYSNLIVVLPENAQGQTLVDCLIELTVFIFGLTSHSGSQAHNALAVRWCQVTY